jgi:hypothetical protein
MCIPKAWKQVKVTFILKPGKVNYAEAEASEPICLVSFMLKTVERLVDRHIKNEILGLHPLHRYQFAYQPANSTETALHHVSTLFEEAVENREVTLGAFEDIKGAFYSTSIDIVTKATKWHVLRDDLLVDWLCAGWEENYNHICRRNSGGICGQGLSIGRHSIASAVEPGCG